jgi:hypothetical protein
MVLTRENCSRRRFVAGLITGSLFATSWELIAGVKSVSLDTGETVYRGRANNRIPDSAIKDAIRKAQNFEHDYDDDVFLNHAQSRLLRSVLLRFGRLQRIVGYGNFNLIDFDSARYYAKHYSSIGAFTRQESDLIDELFEFDASNYGFFGQKVSQNLTEKIKRKDVKKIKGSGHYLYQGEALALYHKIKKKTGDDLILTSGIRSVVKQIHLFIAKVDKSGGNLSRAARSLAPPGHSFHGIGDFDVGQRGLGAANFTNRFAQTELYDRLLELGYIRMRYPVSNPYGVRHEPWHIKVVENV